ncbi:MAG: pimeloyl-[acyl-carrier protein] methyl ester esterase, partial [Gammaproteobacteria bacterium]|nr:pimeloyl-[acyl-carrier protein] methyl ester esterase [Gammaproteobacteria bacterium]
RFVQDEGWACAMRVATFRQFADALDADPQATLLRFLALQVKGDDHAHGTLRLLRTELAQRPAASRAGLRQGLDLLLANDLRDELAALDCPQHWWFGARDTLVPAAAAAAVRTLAPAAEVRLIAGAGHAPCLSHPHDCLEGLGCPPGVAHGHG